MNNNIEKSKPNKRKKKKRQSAEDTSASNINSAQSEVVDVDKLVAIAKKRERQSGSNEESLHSKKKKKKRRKIEDENACSFLTEKETGEEELCTPILSAQFSDRRDVSNKLKVEQDEEKLLSLAFPFPYLEEDCCETKADAYENIASFLDAIAHKLNKSRDTLKIYDPYFCEGAMIKELNSLGFMDIYNKKEDFYAVQDSNQVPDYDVLVTNPPYSGDHVERLLTYCCDKQKPYFLLMPNYCYMKDYFIRIFSSSNPIASHQFFVAPLKRLLYTTPKGRRQQKSSKFTSPFPTFWYCYLGKSWQHLTDSLVHSVRSNSCRIARRIYQLPVEVLTDADPRKKKERDKLKRSKNKAKKKQNKI